MTITSIEALAGKVAAAACDPEVRAALHGTSCGIVLVAREGTQSVRLALSQVPDGPQLELVADADRWAAIAQPAPPVGWHSFTAAARQPQFQVIGSPLQVAQCMHALERLFEMLRGQQDEESQEPLDYASISGSYITLAQGRNRRLTTVYLESSGKAGRPILLMLHTAGADSRQFHPLMADAQLRANFRLHAFDMPGHGRSPMMPSAWKGYVLTKQDYLEVVAAVASDLRKAEGVPLVLMGCSMGAAMALHAARELPGLVDGVFALEAPFRAAGRRTNLLAHAQVNQAAHNPGYVRGLMSPMSPLGARRQAAWIYSSGAFQVYSGDLSFYSDDFDAEKDVKGLDGRTRTVVLATGSYDYSATPQDSRRVADMIPGSTFLEMPDMGHFPMTENPRRFLEYARPLLAQVLERLPKTSKKPTDLETTK